MKPPKQWIFREHKCPIEGHRMVVIATPEWGKTSVEIVLRMAPHSWRHLKAHCRKFAPTVTDQYRKRQVARRKARRAGR